MSSRSVWLHKKSLSPYSKRESSCEEGSCVSELGQRQERGGYGHSTLYASMKFSSIGGKYLSIYKKVIPTENNSDNEIYSSKPMDVE